MSKALRFWFIYCLIVCLSSPFCIARSQTKTAPAFKISDLTFLKGNWRSDIDGGIGEEHWSGLEGNNIMGMYRLVNGGKAVAYTFMVIQQTEMGIRMKADISYPDQELVNRTHRETLIQLEHNKAVFEYDNKQGHTTYLRTSATTLSVFNTKILNGKEQTREFQFTLMK